MRVRPDGDYELTDGERFVRNWNGLVRAEDAIVTEAARLVELRLEYERRLLNAPQAGRDEFSVGGGSRFVAAARRWRVLDSKDTDVLERPYDRAVDVWNDAYDEITTTYDSESDVSDLVVRIRNRFRQSFFARDSYFDPL